MKWVRLRMTGRRRSAIVPLAGNRHTHHSKETQLMIPQARTTQLRARARNMPTPAAVVVAALVLSAPVAVASAPSGRPPAIATASNRPATVTAKQLPPSSHSPLSPRGTIVSSSKLGVRVFVNAKSGFALATLTKGGGATYPAATVNGGKSWRIDGSEFHVAAADAPDVVTQLGVASPATYFAYGGPAGGNSVDVSADGGKHWWRAYLGGAVYAVVSSVAAPRAHELIAFTHLPGVYVSADGGRHWRHRNVL
jgi:hypothetical protein